MSHDSTTNNQNVIHQNDDLQPQQQQQQQQSSEQSSSSASANFDNENEVLNESESLNPTTSTSTSTSTSTTGQQQPVIEETLKQNDVSNTNSTTNLKSVRRKFRALGFGRRKKSLTTCTSSKNKDQVVSNSCSSNNNKKKGRTSVGWGFKLCARTDSCVDVAVESSDCLNSCVCTGYKRTDDTDLSSTTSATTTKSITHPIGNSSSNSSLLNVNIYHNNESLPSSSSGLVNLLSHIQNGNESTESASEQAQVYSHLNSHPNSNSNSNSSFNASNFNIVNNNYHEANLPSSVMSTVQVRVSELALALRNQLAITVSPYPYLARWGEMTELTPGFINRFCLRTSSSVNDSSGLSSSQNEFGQVHTQIDYIHCLVPDLLNITNCSFYWGKMDRYEAEKLLENKPEGTFLLRDSAQEEHLFSVSFRRFDRSLHARIEQWNHKFSFDSHDPGVFSSSTVCGLIEHYKDPSHCMFFEPMLTIPLHRNNPFSLQHLCRATICSKISYDRIQQLELPKRLKNYLKEYHYKQQVRVRRLDVDH